MTIEIKHRYTGDVLYTYDGEDMGQAVLAALQGGPDLRGADLSGANLSGADLSGADLSGPDLRGPDLRGPDLRGADLSGPDLRGADLSGADLRGADLRGADLSGADLSGANLSGAYLRGADLSGADLRGAKSVVELPVADPRGYRMFATQPKDGEWLITAGCRGPWTLEQARKHWGSSDYDGSDLTRRRYIHALDWWEREGGDYRAESATTDESGEQSR